MKCVASMAALIATVGAVCVAFSPGAAQTAPPPAFAACKACHTVEKGGRNGIGPNLNGIVGKPAATTPGFAYSTALKASKLTWDEATLSAFLAAPSKKVPGTKMPIGTPDAAKRAAIIAYLKGGK